MTRRGSSAPVARPARRLAVATLLVTVALLAAACGGGEPTAQPGASGPPTALPSEPALPTQAPAATTPPSNDPATAVPATEPPPSDVLETDEPAEQTDDPPAGAAQCAGTDDNRDFFADAADLVDWNVYCPDLPNGWYVVSGQYLLADGGRLEISYRGPSGAGLMLQQGSYCSAGGDCVPPGEELGPASFGDREGTLVRIDGGWAVAVDRGLRPSWLLMISGVDEARARTIAADLVRVDD